MTSKLFPASDLTNLPTAQNAPINLLNNIAAKSTEVNKFKSTIIHLEKKFNDVVYGIKEGPPETKKEMHIEHDSQHLVTSLLVIDSSIKSQAVKDLYRLGKF